MLKIATWNLNSIRVRLPHLLEWLAHARPDVLCLQELKCETTAFPYAEIAAAGYHGVVAGQKAYNGVAILSRSELSSTQIGIPGFDDPQQRVIAATCQGVRVISVYCPNGESLTSDKYQYKLRWFSALQSYLGAVLEDYGSVAVAGDYNVAPRDSDVHDPQQWAGEVLCSAPERAAFDDLLALGMADCFRLFEQPPGIYSWWHYRVNAFRRNLGLRIDHILASAELAQRCLACAVDAAPRALERPSDHAPVWASFSSGSSPSS